jgi:DNA replication licensing factor MCM6
MFARCFKPKISSEAAAALKEHYKQLRLDSSSGVNAMNRRITVRQLESLVRLSEALARLYCSPEVTRKHVDDAVKLVRDCNKPVVKNDIDLEDDFNAVCLLYIFKNLKPILGPFCSSYSRLICC